MFKTTRFTDLLGAFLFGLACCLLIWQFEANRIPPEPPDQQAEQVDDDSGLGSRSSDWPRIRAEFVAEFPACAACGTTATLNVHHVKPYWIHPELELEKSNLITLCRVHHFTLGHDPDGPTGPQKPDWKKSNANVRRDAARFSRR